MPMTAVVRCLTDRRWTFVVGAAHHRCRDTPLRAGAFLYRCGMSVTPIPRRALQDHLSIWPCAGWLWYPCDEWIHSSHGYHNQPAQVYFTGNPLRFGEPNLLYAAQVSTFGGPATVSKCLQNVAAIVQNIQALYAVLYALTFANDFAKKLIGKYIVIEQESAFRNFMRMSKLDPVNEKADFELLKAEIMRLNKEYSFDYLRDKLASHRDADMDLGAIVQAWQKLTRYSLQQYNDALQIHLNRVLARHPLELDYFKELGPLQGDVRPVKVAEWVPFDDPLIPE